MRQNAGAGELASFDRRFFHSPRIVSRIAAGALGAKAERLAAMQRIGERLPPRAGVRVEVPRLVVLATGAWDAFLSLNRVSPEKLARLSDERIAHAFQRYDLPPEIVGDLQELAEEAHTPLAVRSSSLLEDSLKLPFAGIYQTKMLPNNDPDPAVRFRALVEAIKFVYASTFFAAARNYRRAAGVAESAEKMAVIVQEIVGRRHGERFYPDISAVCRSYNWYPRPPAAPEDGVAELALGLGKTIVEGGRCWSYSPRYPKAPPPFASASAMMRETQARFWAVNMGPPPAYDPTAETEYLVQATLADAEYDGVLTGLASTYDGGADRLRPGTGHPGPRVLDFAPLLQLRTYPLNEALRDLLQACQRELDDAVEIELALTLPGPDDAELRVGFVQVRPMVTPAERVALRDEDFGAPDLLLRSLQAMGNGERSDVRDIVYLRPETFDPARTPALAAEVAALNLRLQAEKRPYLLIGFGRWGSSEPWLGVPVQWGDVAGARVIVEAEIEALRVEPSQGAHFFHNVVNLGVLYFTVRQGAGDIDWAWLARQPAQAETRAVRHVRLAEPLRVRVDGRGRRGIIQRPRAAGPDEAGPDEASHSAFTPPA